MNHYITTRLEPNEPNTIEMLEINASMEPPHPPPPHTPRISQIRTKVDPNVISQMRFRIISEIDGTLKCVAFQRIADD